MSLAPLGELLLPWYTQGSELNTSEASDLAKARLKPMTIDYGVKNNMDTRAISVLSSRLRPYLERMVKVTPVMLPTLTSKLSKAGALLDGTIDGIVTWVKQSPTNAILMLSTIASMGFAVTDLFDDAPRDPKVAEFKRDLASVSDSVLAGALKQLDAIGSKSELMAGSPTTTAEEAFVLAKKKTLKYAKSFFGSIPEALMAHRYLQAFTEMSREQIIKDYNDYRLDNVSVQD